MKKLAFVAVAALAGSVFATGELTSANIVGYTQVDKTGQMYVPFGACFMQTGTSDTPTFRLGDLVLENAIAGADLIQVLESTKAAVTAKYRYVTVDQAIAMEGTAEDAGWYDVDIRERKDDVEFPLGTGFLASFGSKAVTPRFAGQVVDGAYELDCTGKEYVMFANPIPKEITLGDIVLEGAIAGADLIQVLESTKAAATAKYRYVTVEQAIAMEGTAEDAGWYDVDIRERKDDVKVAVGEAFLAFFGSKNVKIVFPAAY